MKSFLWLLVGVPNLIGGVNGDRMVIKRDGEHLYPDQSILRKWIRVESKEIEEELKSGDSEAREIEFDRLYELSSLIRVILMLSAV